MSKTREELKLARQYGVFRALGSIAVCIALVWIASYLAECI